MNTRTLGIADPSAIADLIAACKALVAVYDAVGGPLRVDPALAAARAALARVEAHAPESCRECGAPFNNANAPASGLCAACGAREDSEMPGSRCSAVCGWCGRCS